MSYSTMKIRLSSSISKPTTRFALQLRGTSVRSASTPPPFINAPAKSFQPFSCVCRKYWCITFPAEEVTVDFEARRTFRRAAVALVLLAALAGVSRTLAQSDALNAGGQRPDWPTIGHDATDTRNQPFERDISAANVHRLAPKWVANTSGDVSA